MLTVKFPILPERYAVYKILLELNLFKTARFFVQEQFMHDIDAKIIEMAKGDKNILKEFCIELFEKEF